MHSWRLPFFQGIHPFLLFRCWQWSMSASPIQGESFLLPLLPANSVSDAQTEKQKEKEEGGLSGTIRKQTVLSLFDLSGLSRPSNRLCKVQSSGKAPVLTFGLTKESSRGSKRREGTHACSSFIRPSSGQAQTNIQDRPKTGHGRVTGLSGTRVYTDLHLRGREAGFSEEIQGYLIKKHGFLSKATLLFFL